MKTNRKLLWTPKKSECWNYWIYRIQKNIAWRFWSSEDVQVPIEIVETENPPYIEWYIDRLIDSCWSYDRSDMKTTKPKEKEMIQEEWILYGEEWYLFKNWRQVFLTASVWAVLVILMNVMSSPPPIAEAQMIEIENDYTLDEQLSMQNEIIKLERISRDQKYEQCSTWCNDEFCERSCESERLMWDAMVRIHKATKDRIKAKIIMQ